MDRFNILLIALLMHVSFGVYASSSVNNYIKEYQSQLFYPEIVASFYPYSQLKWQLVKDRRQLKNQLGLLVLADVNDDLQKRYDLLQQTQGLEFDILATDTLLYFSVYKELIATHGIKWLFGGRLDGNIGQPSAFAINTINQHFQTNNLYQLVITLQPQSEQYSDLYERLYLYYDPYHQEAPKLEITRLLKPNQIIPYKSLVYRLNISGDLNKRQLQYFLKKDSRIYNEELVTIVKGFQERHGLVADGIIGEKTLYWLNMSANERVRIIALNIQRLRLWEEKSNRFVLVNIPSYEMGYFQEGELIFKSKVIVGKPARRTPLFTTRLDSIVFNPKWKVPTKIMREDILPKAFDNKEYLTEHNFEVLPSWLSNSVIPFESIKWEEMTAENFPYKLRQKPGGTNALGKYKFNTPNKNSIYLHDTPLRSLFKKQHRAYSSGCIRVEKASEFAQLLMEESDYTATDYENYNQLPKTNSVGLGQKIAVYTTYQTTWIDDKDIIQFRDDIYKYDEWSKSKID